MTFVNSLVLAFQSEQSKYQFTKKTFSVAVVVAQLVEETGNGPFLKNKTFSSSWRHLL